VSGWRLYLTPDGIERGSSPINRGVSEFLLDPEQLVIFREPLRPGYGAALDLSAVRRDGDIGAIKNKPPMHIPYPNSQRLAEMVSQPGAILPPMLVGEESAARAPQRGLAR